MTQGDVAALSDADLDSRCRAILGYCHTGDRLVRLVIKWAKARELSVDGGWYSGSDEYGFGIYIDAFPWALHGYDKFSLATAAKRALVLADAHLKAEETEDG